MHDYYFEGIDRELTELESAELAQHEERLAAAYAEDGSCIVTSKEADSIQADEDFKFREYRLRRDRLADLESFKEHLKAAFFGSSNLQYDLQASNERNNLAAKKLRYDTGKTDHESVSGRRAYAAVFLERQAGLEQQALEPSERKYGYNGDREKDDYHRTAIKQLNAELRTYVEADLSTLDAKPEALAATPTAVLSPLSEPVRKAQLTDPREHTELGIFRSRMTTALCDQLAETAGFAPQNAAWRKVKGGISLIWLLATTLADAGYLKSTRDEAAKLLGKRYGHVVGKRLSTPKNNQPYGMPASKGKEYDIATSGVLGALSAMKQQRLID